MQRKYKNPPLVELVCEFRLPPQCAWDLTMPGLIYDKVRNEFPNRKPRLLHHFELGSGSEGIGERFRTERRVLFLASQDKRLFLEVGPRLLGVHSQVTPYPGWQHFKPKIEVGFKALMAVSDTEKLRGVSLRYINRIEVPDDSGGLEKYLNFRPLLAENEGMTITSFIGGTRFSIADDSCRVELQSTVPDDPGDRAFLLVIDYSLAPDKTIEQERALEWVESAHDKVDELFFERCIKQPLRDLFGEIR
ncbi:MAG: hypothetical protein DRH70_06645 [Candidatus Coatesbacteria bacterium]|nr:MAG: hypothetical protein DRH70_06645 [Candidatus Coatesbacteria bacterium]